MVDTLASIAAIIGAKLPDPAVAAEDSHDVSAAWLGRPHASPLRPHLIVHSADGNFAIRRDGWKWIEGVPAADVRAASRKARAEQFHPMLFHVADDVAETREAAAANPGRAAELKSLLDRYRNGGYSRELPPVVDRPKAVVAPLQPLVGRVVWELPLDVVPAAPWTTSGGAWSAREGAIWVKAGEKGARLEGPLGIEDGAIEVQIRLGEADRVSLRIHASAEPPAETPAVTPDEVRSYRVVLSRGAVDVAVNPAKGDPDDRATELATKRLKFDAAEWQTLRLTFAGDELTAQVAGQTLRCRDPLFVKRKDRLHGIAFEGEVGLRRLVVVAADRSARMPSSVTIARDDLGYGDAMSRRTSVNR